MTQPAVFRSIHLTADLAEPYRFAHYRPTRKSSPVLQAVLKPHQASMVVAAYGSGKSMSAGVAALAVRGDPDDHAVVLPMLDRMRRFDPELAGALRRRLAAGSRGRIVILSGHVEQPLAAIAEQAGLPDTFGSLDSLAKALAKSCQASKHDHVAIVWDEFGRHLEALIDLGRSRELDFVQRLAEWASRADGPSGSLTLLMHQNLLAYAGRLNQATRTEWRKVEGRFSSLRFVEDSAELYDLVADVIRDTRPPRGPGRPRRMPDFGPMAEAAAEAGWFGGSQEPKAISSLLERARPFSGGALHALPGLVARVGQNERSLFGFIADAVPGNDGAIGFEEIYSAFSDAMRSDVGIGGSYRRWVETESARSRAHDAVEREVLAAACILQLGHAGERRRLRRSVLQLAVASRGIGPEAASAAIDALVSRSLLLWRMRNDDISVWHGADVDVAGRVREERDRRAESFDLQAFATSRLAAPTLRPSGHNVRFGTSRHLPGRFLTARQVIAIDRNGGGWPPHTLPRTEEDGRVVYVIAADAGDLETARNLLVGPLGSNCERTIFVLPNEPFDIEEAALEIVALEAIRSDAVFLASDPLVAAEIDELLSVAQTHLGGLVRRLTEFRPQGATWYCNGVPLDITADRPASVVVSRLADVWFPATPMIGNDAIMRDRISRQMRTARVRVMRNSLERCGDQELGYDSKDRSAEASVFRTVLGATGLYRDGSFAEADDIADEALAAAWREIEGFFVEPAEDKPLALLVDKLASAPFGLPQGVIPLLAAGGYRKFARAVALSRNGQYMPDLLGFEVDRIFEEPESYSVQVLETRVETIRYLEELAYAFSHQRDESGSLERVRLAFDALARWKASVPGAARRTLRLSEGARELMRLTSSQTDPVALFMRMLPELAGTSADRSDFAAIVVQHVETWRKEIDRLVEGYTTDAVKAVREILAVETNRQPLPATFATPDVLPGVTTWVGCFDLEQLLGRRDLRITDKAILRTAAETANGRFSPQSFARSLSSVLLQRGLEQWDDASVSQFRSELREARSRIEEAALDSEHPSPSLRPVIEARIDHLHELLRQMPDASNVVGMRKSGT